MAIELIFLSKVVWGGGEELSKFLRGKGRFIDKYTKGEGRFVDMYESKKRTLLFLLP